MQEQDKAKFKELMMIAGEVYGKEISKELLRANFVILQSLPIEQVTAGMMAHMQDPDSGQYFPKPADIIRRVSGTSKQQAAAISDRASMAWACIEREIRRIGSYGTLDIEDKQAMAAVKAMGGWKSLCASTTEELVWKHKEFASIYETFERTPVELLPSKLPGRFELEHHKAECSSELTSLMLGVEQYREKMER